MLENPGAIPPIKETVGFNYSIACNFRTVILATFRMNIKCLEHLVFADRASSLHLVSTVLDVTERNASFEAGKRQKPERKRITPHPAHGG